MKGRSASLAIREMQMGPQRDSAWCPLDGYNQKGHKDG